ncbi:MAG: phosphatidylglycerol lysyltransferase domain-containing protein, partial [Deltaproteobacteria bacterium]
LSFAGLSLYDVLATQTFAPGRIPPRVAALTGAGGYAVSNLLGASWLTGTAIRYRVYASFGLDLSVVTGIFVTSWVAFWAGIIAILAVLFVFYPAGLSQVLPISPTLETALGASVLTGLVGGFLWLNARPHHLRIVGVSLPLPAPRTALSLLVVAAIDMLGAALTLYILLPDGVAANFVVFFAVFIGAIALGVLSHAPGGLGVFEATLIAGLGAGGRSDVLAALLLYRVIYFLLPFLVAATSLAVIWVIQNRRKVTKAGQRAQSIIQPIVPMLAAALALVVGTILLLSGNLPADTTHLTLLRRFVDLPFVEASHLTSSIVGVLSIVVARGLYRKLYHAWLTTMVLFAVGIVASLVKGLDWKEALVLFAALMVLGIFRPAFYRLSTASVFHLTAGWIVSLAGLLAATLWVGFFAHSHVAYRDTLWWEFAWHGDASRFLRASLAVSVVLLIVSFNSVVFHRGKRIKPEPIPQAVRDLLAQATDAEAQIALTGDKAFLVAPDAKAFLAYADSGRTYIAKGDPVGDPDAARQLIWDLREQADLAGRRCAFYGVSSVNLATYLDLGLNILKIGEIARINLATFTLDGPKRKDFRYITGRSQRDGY